MKKFIKNLLDNFWVNTDDFNYEIYNYESGKPFFKEVTSFTDNIINESFKFDNEKWEHTEYVKVLKKRVYVEPDYSYCITDFNKIILSSAFYPKLKPSVPRYLRSLLSWNNLFLKKAILFDGQVGTNYFHFFSDILNKIWLIKKFENLRDIPLIIGEKTYRTLFFQHLLENTEIRNFRWVVQRNGQYLIVDEIIFIKPMPYERHYFEQVKSLLLKNDSSENKRIFLNRSKETGRYIKNFNEIEPVLKKYNFQILDTQNLPFKEQVLLFNCTRYLIGIHGAGETNIIFSRKDLCFLEITPLNRIACQYYWLAKSLKIRYYDVVLGGSLPHTHVYPEKGFVVDHEKLESAILRMLETDRN